MNLWRLVRREILARKLSAALAVLIVGVAVGVLVAQVGLLRAHDAHTERVLHEKQEEAQRRFADMEDEYRKAMKELGFNVLILPAEQDMAEFWLNGVATATMPEEHVAALARTGTTLMRHLLPIVQQRIRWPEKQREIILVGTRGEVPILDRGQKEPMLDAVPDGKVVVGHQVATDLELAPGSTITLRGTTLEVLDIRPRQGAADDHTLWVGLAAAQAMLGMEGRINAIEALKCECVSTDRRTVDQEIAALTAAITDALPGVQVVVRDNKVIVRARARLEAKRVHHESIRKWEADRAELRSRRERFAAILVPLVMLGAAGCVAGLTLMNVRERRTEIGILRAIGLRSRQVLVVFLARAAMVGAAGAVVGAVLGAMAASVLAMRDGEVRAAEAVAPLALVATLVAAPVVSALAALVPATMAARHDPADILCQE
jgi:hypothetical protein